MLTDRYLHPGIFARMLTLAVLLNLVAYASPQETVPASTPDHPVSDSASSQAPDQAAPPSSATSSPESAPKSKDQLPDSPGASQAQTAQGTTQSVPEAQQPAQPQNRGHEPVGTAAAESIPTSGVAASRPAGAALAPAKQRRIRSILIKTGALVGVGVAIGTAMALSEGSPSKPPGSH